MLYKLFQLTYTAPHIRVIPFQAGMLIGYFAYWIRKHPVKMELKAVRIAWSLFIACLVVPIFFSSDAENISTLVCALTYSLMKFIYGVCVGGIIILNVFAPDCLIQRILSHGWFVHLNKISYGMYLMHPIVIFLISGTRSQPLVLTDLLWVSI